MKQKLQWELKASINAPVAKVWNAIEDLSLIPTYHPVVRKVELLSGQSKRAPGIKYKCIIPEGPQRGWCVEQVVENIPNQKMTTAFPEDSWGISKMFSDFITELTLEAINDNTTVVHLSGYYTVGLKAKLMNVIIMRRVMRKRASDTLQGLKHLIEESA